MTTPLTSGFLTSKWMEKAKKYVSNPLKMKTLLLQTGAYLSKDGLGKVKDKLLLLYKYVQDVLKGTYKEYSKSKLLTVIAVLIYVVTPLDFIPDLLPAGLLDDSALVLWAFKELEEELKRYQSFLNSKK